MVPPALFFLQCKLHVTPGVLADPARIDRDTKKSGFGLTWFPLLPIFSVSLILLLEVLGVWLTALGLMKNSERLGFFYSCRSGQRDTSLEEFNEEVEGWLPLLPEFSLLRLTGQMLVDVVLSKVLLLVVLMVGDGGS